MGFVGDALGAVGGVLGDTVGEIPVIGDVVKAGLPIAGSMIGGPIGGAIGGGLSQGMAGGDPMQGAAGGFGLQQSMEAFRQAEQDRQRSRELTNRALEQAGRSSDLAMDLFRRDAPLRQQYRQGAMSFFDPTNPFANPVGGFPQQGPPQTTMPQPQGPVPSGPQPSAPQSGGIPDTFDRRISGVVDRAFDRDRTDFGGLQPAVSLQPSFEPTPFGRGTGPSDGRGGDRRMSGINPMDLVNSRLAKVRERLEGMDLGNDLGNVGLGAQG